MVDLFHRILTFHYTMNQKFHLRSFPMVASYATIATADSTCDLMPENKAEQQKHSFPMITIYSSI